MANPPLELISLERQLEQLLIPIRASDSRESWDEVETIAQKVANGLRVKDPLEDNHTALGKTPLPQTITLLLTLALHGSTIPDEFYTSVIYELLRVAANLCMDHNENRAHLLEAGFPQAIVLLLEGYAESISPPPHPEPLRLSISHLKVVRTAIGVLLNASIGFDPVKFRLISLEAAMTIMKLSTAIYPPGSWLAPSPGNAKETPEDVAESWTLRSGLSNWAWRTISELKDVKDEALQIFNPDVLPLLIPPLLAFSPPFSPSSPIPFARDPPLFTTLINADFEVLEESCMLIESLSLDVEDVRLSLARGLHFPAEHGGVPCLSSMLDFIEKGDYPPLWHLSPVLEEGEQKRRERAFDICKAAVIKAVVEVAGEERNEDVLWDDSEEEKPGGEFVCRMVEWIKRYVADKGKAIDLDGGSFVDRDDLIICASLSLGNLARREKYTTALLSAPHALAPILTSIHLLSPSTDVKLKHGIIGLLKHLAQSASQSSAIHVALGNAGVVERIAGSGVWDEKTDAMAEVVQVSAIGVVKHLCNASVENTFALVLPSTTQVPAPPTGLAQILALVKRSESIPVKSEGTRVLVNVIKSLWSNDPVATPSIPTPPAGVNGSVDEAVQTRQRKRQESMRAVLTPECAFALASLVGRSAKYPLLVNEGVVALSLLCTQRAGGPLVLKAITRQLPVDAAPVTASAASTASTSTSSEVSSPVVATPPMRGRVLVPQHALDMLKAVLKNVDNPANFPIEVRVNVCSLLLQLGKNNSGEDLTNVKDATRRTLERLVENAQGAQGKEEMLGKAAKKVLSAWA